MKILNLDLLRYGPFTETSLDLSAGNHGLHVIFGPNEAGKSTTLRALTGLLFGIEHNTKDAHLHEMSQLRIGGNLRRSDGKELSFVRKKARTKSIRRPENDEPIDDALLASFLPGVDRMIFTSLYGIDHSELVKGGKAILEQRGELGQALYSAAFGTAGLKDLLKNLHTTADDLFKPTGKNPGINAAHQNYKEAIKTAKSATLSSSAWTKLQREIHALNKEIDTTKQSLDEASKEANRLQRAGRIIRPLGNLDEVLSGLKSIGDLIPLSVDFGEQRRRAEEKMRTAKENKDKIEVKIASIRKQRNELVVDEALLAKKARFQELEQDLGAYKKSGRDLPGQIAKRQQLRSQAEEALTAFRPDMDLDEVSALKPSLARRKMIDDLVLKDRELATGERSVSRSIRDHQKKREQMESELEALPASIDSSPLVVAVTTAKKSGDLDTRIEESMTRRSESLKTCQLDLRRLGLWNGSLEDFEGLSLPLTETVEKYNERFSALAEERRDIERRRKEQIESCRNIEKKLADLSAGHEVPTHKELEQSREYRARGWQMIRRSWLDGEDTSTAAKDYDPDRTLPEAYERSVEHADQAADRMYQDVERVEQHRTLTERLRNVNKAREALDDDLLSRDKEIAVIEQEWKRSWAVSRIEPLSPREMLSWLRRVDNLRLHVGELRKAQAEIEQIQSLRQKHRSAIVAVLNDIGIQIESGDALLTPLLVLAEERLVHLQEIETKRREFQRRKEDTSADLTRVEDGKTDLDAQRKQWKTDWRRAVSWLNLSEEASPAEATMALDQLEKVCNPLEKANQQNKRIYGIEKDIEEFEEAVSIFSESLGMDTGDQTIEEVITDLSVAMVTTQKNKERIESFDEQFMELEEEKAELLTTIEAMKARLNELMQQARVEQEEELTQAEQKSNRYRELVQRKNELTLQLQDTGDGYPIEALKKHAEGHDIDTLPGLIDEITGKAKELSEQLEQLREQRSALHAREKELDGSAAAAEAQAHAMQILTQMREDVERYLRARTAAHILETRIELFRRENQTPLLARASELFSLLTLGSYKGLHDDLDGKGNPIILGIRPDDRQVPVEGMSDGACDQLYLSLRLSALERHLKQGEIVPFVVDDILIGFDDERSKAALEVIAELAGKTQVLLFTHHRRVVELAEKVKATAGVFIHELG